MFSYPPDGDGGAAGGGRRHLRRGRRGAVVGLELRRGRRMILLLQLLRGRHRAVHGDATITDARLQTTWLCVFFLSLSLSLSLWGVLVTLELIDSPLTHTRPSIAQRPRSSSGSQGRRRRRERILIQEKWALFSSPRRQSRRL